MVAPVLPLPPRGEVVYVPVQNWGFLSGTAVVVDAVTRQPLRFPRADVVLAGVTVCVKAELLHEVPGRCRVKFADGRTAWVRPWAPPAPDAPDAA